jgi:tRNA(Ile2)-agmatinylcytidine synthase
LQSKDIPDEIKEFHRLAMFDILSKQKATKLAQKYNLNYFSFGNGQGLVGAIAAIGCLLNSDHTFEILAYRKIKNCGTLRIIDPINVIYLDRSTFPSTFNCYDHVHERILIATWTRSGFLRDKRRRSGNCIRGVKDVENRRKIRRLSDL